MTSGALVVRRGEVGGRIVDVVIVGGQILRIGADLEAPVGARVVDARGGAVLTGLVDHHIHLFATAAADQSVDVSGGDGLARIGRESGGGWLRVIGAATELSRSDLDAHAPERPVRVQHRSGALWTLNSAAIAELDRAASDPSNVGGLSPLERRTGQLWRADERLRAMVPTADPPDVAALGRRLAARGVTTVVDATPTMSEQSLALLRDQLPQRVVALGTDAGPAPRKVVLGDHALPSLADLVATFDAVHRAGRGVALHCVTRESLVLAVVALKTAGALTGDRVEHAAVCDDAMASDLAELGVVVVTQPSLVHRRGDDYLSDCDLADRPLLWRHRGLLDAGVRVALSSDAPYGDPDPWRTVWAAATRLTTGGAVLGEEESVAPIVALEAMQTHPLDPGGAPRRLLEGDVADLCVLDRPLAAAVEDPLSVVVRCTVAHGEVAFME
ncbi:hypothetical protein ASG88_17760 [Nocardioides sp. Soil777]|uniref:amidohydrolase family protein n=1 Tax=Nocardioides sp. Soil777 TaxID=1736409 RepID=UPI00070361FD|nr:amidohydrolase family protein [Nocardioides sp. Soil777]KRE98024.1 hypothetical protein ASG88_17760 [Nocardioides sp. Soil777]